MIRTVITSAAVLAATAAVMIAAETAPPIVVVDGTLATEKLPVPGDVFFGQTIVHEEMHGDTVARVGIWEAGVSRSRLVDYPFTEYVLMLSGQVVLTNQDGTSNTYGPGDTFIIPKGWTGIWDIREHMRKQMVQIGDPGARPRGERLDN